MGDPRLERLGRFRALEGWLEGQIPVVVAGVWWGLLVVQLSRPTASHAFTGLELAVLLGAGVGLSGWACSRVMYLLGVRRPLIFPIAGLLLAVLLVQALQMETSRRYEKRCEALQGRLELPGVHAAGAGLKRSTCIVGGYEDNLYQPGAILRAPWAGSRSLGLPSLLVLAFMAVTGSLAFRDRRLRRSRQGRRLIEAFSLAPGAGLSSVRGEPDPDNPGITGCANRTLWGEICGQLYWEGSIEPGGACVRCGFGFLSAEPVSLKVVSLVTDRVDRLNVAERGLATRAFSPWPQGKRARPAVRGPVRWSLFKEIRLPRIITVTQALALVIEQLEGGEGEAAALAKKKASRVSGWLWSLPPGVPFRSRLAVQDGASCTLLAGTERLGDALDRESGEPYLQLDVGLIPIALRFGNAWTSREKEDVKERYGNRPGNTPASEEEGGLKERFENQHVVVWLPVRSPHTRGAAATTWVPRVETAALRTWLEVVHRIEEGEEGGNVLPYVWPKDASPGSWKDGVGRDLEFLSPAPSDLPTELTLLRMSWGKGKWPEPVVDRSHGLMGASLDEWEWLDREQIEQLRQGVVVAVPKDYRTRLVRRLEDTGADGEGQP